MQSEDFKGKMVQGTPSERGRAFINAFVDAEDGANIMVGYGTGLGQDEDGDGGFMGIVAISVNEQKFLFTTEEARAMAHAFEQTKDNPICEKVVHPEMCEILTKSMRECADLADGLDLSTATIPDELKH